MNRCRPEENGTNEHGQMLNIIVMLEEGGVLDRRAEGWKNGKGNDKSHKEGVQEVEGIANRAVEHRQEEDARRQRSTA